MKTLYKMGISIRLLAITALVASTVTGQSAGPSPTASVGCEPHGDHWYDFLSACTDDCALAVLQSSANCVYIGIATVLHPLLCLL